MKVFLFTIGDEILIGQITDTNSAWMGRHLNQFGIRVCGKSSVGDTREAILNGLQQAENQADIIIMTGGLGPTKDDITKKVLAEKFGSTMVFHQETFDRIAAYFEKIQRPLPPTMHQQATLPDNAAVLTNKVGTAPGMWFSENGKVYISLPGVPMEMEYLMTHEVVPRLRERFDSRPIAHRGILTVGVGESVIAQRINDWEDALPDFIKLAYLPGLGLVRLRLTGIWPSAVTDNSQAELEQILEEKIQELAAFVPDHFAAFGDKTIEQIVGEKLLVSGKSISTAESCTGGYIAHLITSISGSSAYFPGSFVCYSNEMKQKHLGVKAKTLEKHGAVSAETVREMALGALKKTGADIALAVSGIAGPNGGTPEKPVGTVWVAVADKNRVETAKLKFGRDRIHNIKLTATYALDLVRKFLNTGD